MLPDPLHPAIVHFPIVLTVLLPISAAGALWAIRRGARPLRAWAIPLGLATALAVSAFVAVQTGASEEERVESVVAERAIEAYEHGAASAYITSGAPGGALSPAQIAERREHGEDDD